jgi:hypothetical protein
LSKVKFLLDSQWLFLDTSITFAPDDFKKQSSVAHLLGCTCSFVHLCYFSLTPTKALEEKAYTECQTQTLNHEAKTKILICTQLSDKLGIANPTALLGFETQFNMLKEGRKCWISLFPKSILHLYTFVHVSKIL